MYKERASQMALVVKNPPANAGELRDAGSVPGSGRYPGGEHVNPLQYSCLENPMDRTAWQATVQRVEKSLSWLKQLSTHTWVAQVRLCPLKFIYSLNKYSLSFLLCDWHYFVYYIHMYIHIYIYTHTHTPGEACILIFSKLVNFYLYDYNLF